MKEIRRVNRSKEQAKVNYNHLSRFYDWIAGSERKMGAAGLARLNIRPGEKVLEVGFGTGHGLLLLARSVGSEGKVYGIDLAQGMVSVALSRLKKKGLADRAELHCGDALDLPFAENAFDAIFASFTLELFDTPEIPVVLRQFWRVLKNDGRICVVSMSRAGKVGRMVKLYEWAHEKFPVAVDCRPIYARQSIEDAGFKICNTTMSSLMNLPIEIILAEKHLDITGLMK
jgi:ubiquinone/menaquinone biosynthesis C-methylase UbiE